jgi:hypothetical protein
MKIPNKLYDKDGNEFEVTEGHIVKPVSKKPRECWVLYCKNYGQDPWGLGYITDRDAANSAGSDDEVVHMREVVSPIGYVVSCRHRVLGPFDSAAQATRAHCDNGYAGQICALYPVEE